MLRHICLHSALPLMAIYQCIKFHLIPFYTFRVMLRTSFLLQKLRREVIPYILVTGLWFLHSAIHLMALYQCSKFHLFIFNTFRDMLWTSLLLQKLEREITLKLLVIELRFLHSALSLMAVCQCIKFYLISFYTFRDMLQTSFLLQKLRRGVTPVNTGDRVMVLTFCNSPHGPLSVYQVSLNYLQYF